MPEALRLGIQLLRPNDAPIRTKPQYARRIECCARTRVVLSTIFHAFTPTTQLCVYVIHTSSNLFLSILLPQINPNECSYTGRDKKALRCQMVGSRPSGGVRTTRDVQCSRKKICYPTTPQGHRILVVQTDFFQGMVMRKEVGCLNIVRTAPGGPCPCFKQGHILSPPTHTTFFSTARHSYLPGARHVKGYATFVSWIVLDRVMRIWEGDIEYLYSLREYSDRPR